jgi:phospholipid/cholesterol/gamma-HCH transport system permease protein
LPNSTVSPAAANLELTPSGSIVRCTGSWTLRKVGALERRLACYAWPTAAELTVDASGVFALDTAGAWLLHRTMRALEQDGRTVRLDGLRPEHEALLRLIQSRAAVEGIVKPPTRGLLVQIGRNTWFSLGQLVGILAFIGESTVALLRALAHPSRIRWTSILYNLQAAGFNALPITGLLAFLMGVVVSYQGASQLARYGANIFVADLVGLSMLRELGPLLTAIIVAGRSGSAYAAQIGTMKVTEEIDALTTVGVAPMDLLVLPKLLALVVALPLLTVYADLVGVLGGMLMAKTELGVDFTQFLNRFEEAIKLSSFLVGLGKAPVFAGIIALVGCFQGFQVGGSAESVGRQTTMSVVQAIFLVIVTDAVFSVVFNWLQI